MSSRVFLLPFFIFSIILSSCSSSSSNAYPTYDPFQPVGATNAVPPPQDGVIVQSTGTPRGPAPTRAPISIPIPTRNPSLGLTTPTPDSPHPLPPPRDYVDQYTVQPGDTLGIIAQRYGISLEVLLQANGLNEASILSVGAVLNIPPVVADPNPGSSFKIIPDSELIFGPASIGFDLSAFVKGKNGYLETYSEDVHDELLSGSQIIMRVAENYSVNPRLLLALLEYRSGWVTNPAPSNVVYPFGYINDYSTGLYRQAVWAADNLSRGYYLWRVNAIATLPLNDGSYVPLDPTVNAGTMGVQYFFSLFNDRVTWDLDVSGLGLFQTYTLFFGSPFDYDIASLLPLNLIQPPMQLPFEPGVTWAFTGGPHGGWDASSAWGALDFAPPLEGMGCDASDLWVTAVADGYIVRAGNGAVMQDLDNDGYEQTGWNVLYMHMAEDGRIPAGMFAYAGDRIGHPSCEGGLSNATHLHLARKYNGEWISADTNVPFNLDGWISSGNGIYYDGYLSRNGITLQAEEGVFEGVNLISR